MGTWVSYFYLFCTIVLESIGVALLNKSDGFRHWQYLLGGLLFFNIAMALTRYGYDHCQYHIGGSRNFDCRHVGVLAFP
ncbi:SMR family transporter [Methylovulum miyakonense]|uniref:SMR family transporter n=1 Tax=Methylovulum miyakonense TaxID=645578 RepID=UPI0009FCF156